MEKYIDDNWKISSNFPAEYKTEVLCNEKNIICREVEFSYAPEKEQQTERKIMVEFSFPVLDISGRWYPACGFDRSIKADWFPGVESMTSISAPVICFFNGKGKNRHTIALV